MLTITAIETRVPKDFRDLFISCIQGVYHLGKCTVPSLVHVGTQSMHKCGQVPKEILSVQDCAALCHYIYMYNYLRVLQKCYK